MKSHIYLESTWGLYTSASYIDYVELKCACTIKDRPIIRGGPAGHKKIHHRYTSLCDELTNLSYGAHCPPLSIAAAGLARYLPSCIFSHVTGCDGIFFLQTIPRRLSVDILFAFLNLESFFFHLLRFLYVTNNIQHITHL